LIFRILSALTEIFRFLLHFRLICLIFCQLRVVFPRLHELLYNEIIEAKRSRLSRLIAINRDQLIAESAIKFLIAIS